MTHVSPRQRQMLLTRLSFISLLYYSSPVSHPIRGGQPKTGPTDGASPPPPKNTHTQFLSCVWLIFIIQFGLIFCSVCIGQREGLHLSYSSFKQGPGWCVWSQELFIGNVKSLLVPCVCACTCHYYIFATFSPIL